MKKQSENVSSRRVILPGIFMAVIFSAVFALPVWRLVTAYLPMDLTWSQRFDYACSAENLTSWQIREFLEINYIRYRSLAFRQYSQIANDLKVKYFPEKMALELHASCPEDLEGNSHELFQNTFTEFVQACFDIQMVNPDEIQEKDTAQSRLYKWLDENNGKLAEMRREKLELQIEMNRCQQQILSLESQILRQVPQATPAPVTDSQRMSLEQIKEQLSKLQVRQNELDLMAATSKEAAELEEIDRQRDEVYNQRQKLQAAEKLLSNCEESDKSTASDLQKQVENARDSYDFAKYKLNLLDENVAELEAEITSVGKFLPNQEGSVPAYDNIFSVTAFDNSALAEVKDFYLSSSLADIVKTRTLSRLQLLAVSLAGFFGFVLGLSVTRLVLGNTSEETECQEDIAKAELVVPDKKEAFTDDSAGDSADDSADDSIDGQLGAGPESEDSQDDTSDDDPEAQFVRYSGDEDVSSDLQSEEVLADELEDLSNLNGFASWWVESYDKLAFKLCDNRAALADGLIVSALDKTVLSPRFIVNISISLALKGEKVLLVSASSDGILENIFSDFSDDFRIGDVASEMSVGKVEKGAFLTPGFWDCLLEDMPVARYVMPSPLANLKFLHSRKTGGPKDINKDINNNSDYAEIDYDTEFDCILIYMPELLGEGLNTFNERRNVSPISNLLARFSNIAVVDGAVSKKADRKLAAVRNALKKAGCKLIEL